MNFLRNPFGDKRSIHDYMDDLEESIRVYRVAVQRSLPDSPDLPSLLNNLGVELNKHYALTGNLDDLAEAIRVFHRAVSCLPPGSAALPSLLNNLGNGLRNRYSRKGQLEDLQEAIRVYQAAIRQTPRDSPALPSRFDNLAAGLRNRFNHIGSLEDLKEAIRLHRMVVHLTPSDSPDLPRYLNNLGTALRTHYTHTKLFEDLEEAIRVHKTAVNLTSPDSPDLLGRLSNLGAGLSERYARTNSLEDLDEAIQVYQIVVQMSPPGSPDLPGHLNNLGVGLSDRYARTHHLDDIQESIDAFQKAVDQVAAGSPHLPGFLINLGNAFRSRYAHVGHLADVEAAKAVYRRGCDHGLIVAPDAALGGARNWAHWALGRRAWLEAVDATMLGRAAHDRLLAVQINRPTQESILAQAQGLAAQAAYALTQADRLVEAVEAIEQGRARLLAEALEQSRSDLQRLPSLGHRDLYQRYDDTLKRRDVLLQEAAMAASSGAGNTLMTGVERLAAIDRVYNELQAVIAEIQQLPGYEDFFAKPGFAQIQTAFTATGATDSTAAGVYLIATEYSGLALIVHAGCVTPVLLDELTDEVLTILLRSWFAAYEQWQTTLNSSDKAVQKAGWQQWLETVDQITDRLWVIAMGPVADALGNLGLAHDDAQPPAVTLIPTGLLALFPLHAAWTNTLPASGREGERSRRYFLDNYAVHYAPSALALRHCQQRVVAASAATLLAVDEPQPVSANKLLNAGREVKAIASLFPGPAVLQHDQATRATVLDHLTSARVAHFSCHGTNNWQNPLDSGLLMANDKLLTVRDFLELHLPSARLATLSACETGIVGTNLPDEVIMLPSALVQAGYAGVVASLWSVADVSTAMLMVRFYQYWREEGMAPVYALRAAQRWVRDTTNQEKAEYFGQFVPALQSRMAEPVAVEFFSAAMLIEEGLEARSFEHPFWWGAFYLTGV